MSENLLEVKDLEVIYKQIKKKVRHKSNDPPLKR